MKTVAGLRCCVSMLRGNGAARGRRRRRRAHDRRHSRRARRTCSGRAFTPARRKRRRSWASTSSGADRCARTIAPRRCRRSKGSSAAACPASCSRRSTTRRSSPPVADATRTKIPVVVFDSGLKGDDYVSFVATDNRKGGRLGGRAPGEAPWRKGQGRDASLRGRSRQHDQARGRLSRGDRRASRASRSSARTSTAAPTSKKRYKKSEALLSRYKTADGSLRVDGIFCAERIDDVRDAARAPGQRLGGQGAVRRLRCVRQARQGPRRRAHRRPRRSRIPSTWAISA